MYVNMCETVLRINYIDSVLLVSVTTTYRGPWADGSCSLQQVQGLHVSVYVVYRWWSQVPVQFL